MKDPHKTIYMIPHLPFFYVCSESACMIEEDQKEIDRLAEESGDNDFNEEQSKNYQELAHDLRCQSLVAIVFAVMTLENFIYKYAFPKIKHNYYINHIDKLNITSKWVVVTRIITGKELDENDVRMQKMKELISIRNEITHAKGKSHNVRDRDKALKWIMADLDKEKVYQNLGLRSPTIVKESIEWIAELDESEECLKVVKSTLYE